MWIFLTHIEAYEHNHQKQHLLMLYFSEYRNVQHAVPNL